MVSKGRKAIEFYTSREVLKSERKIEQKGWVTSLMKLRLSVKMRGGNKILIKLRGR